MNSSFRLCLILASFLCFSLSSAQAADIKPAYSKYENKELGLKHDQYAKFPTPLKKYEKIDGSIGEKLAARTKGKLGKFNVVATIIFLLAKTMQRMMNHSGITSFTF